MTTINITSNNPAARRVIKNLFAREMLPATGKTLRGAGIAIKFYNEVPRVDAIKCALEFHRRAMLVAGTTRIEFEIE